MSSQPDSLLTTTDLIQGLASELARDPAPLLAVAVDWMVTRLPEYVSRINDSGEDPELMSSTLLDILVSALQSDSELSLYEYWDSIRDLGRRRCQQGVDMETLLEVMSIHRDVVVEVLQTLMRELQVPERVLVHAERRLDALVEKLTVGVVLGYVDAMEDRYQAQQAELEALIAITRSVNRSLELAEVAQAGLTETIKAMRLEAGALWLTDADGSLGLAHTEGLPAREAELVAGWPVQESKLLGDAMAAPRAVQASIRPRIAPLRQFASALAVGLRSPKGELLGLLAVGTRSLRIFSESEMNFANAVADHLVVALEHARQHQREARTDFLTGLANRQEFERSVERHIAAARRTGQPLTVALLDLDNLKTINDTLGHHAGDEAIRAVGQALRQALRASDISARLGGDEFGVALPDTRVDQAEEVARRIQQALRGHASAASLGASVSVSFGFAEWKAGTRWPALFEEADRELYKRKRRRRAAPRRTGSRRSAPAA